MTIDPKELRIGSHVNANGVRAKVIDIHNKLLRPDCKYQIFLEGISPEDGEKKVVGSMVDDLQPISITPELLTELGFEKIDFHGQDVFRKLYKDTPLGKMYYVVNYNPNAEAWNFCVHPSATEVKYLHELESVAYLATKQELIND